MAQAPGHKFGQVIGNYCEAAVGPLLKEIAEKHGLFLDKKGTRPVEWVAELAKHGWAAVHWSTVGDPRAADSNIMSWALAPTTETVSRNLSLAPRNRSC